MTTDTYISDEMLAVALEGYRLAYPERSLAGAQGMRAALEAIAPALVRKGMERAAEVADEADSGNWSRSTVIQSAIMAAREHIVSAIRTAAEEV